MVLVILAILAAALVPALMGYIDRAREKKDIYYAKACLDAAQAGFADVDAVGSSVGEAVKNCTGQEPYIFVVATGNCTKPTSVTNDNKR